MKKSMKVLAVAGVFALVPSFASAFDGILAECLPTAGVKGIVTVSGMDCSEKLTKLKLVVGPKTANAYNNCDATSGGAPWDVWALGKYGSKISQAAAATVTQAELKLKGIAFGSCNFSGSANSAGAYMTGSFQFFDGVGEKVKGGKGSVIARVGADVPTQSATLNGIVSKGLGAGGVARALAGLDPGAAENGNVLACNLGTVCPPDLPEGDIEAIALITNTASVFRIGFPTNGGCTGLNNPFDCCTGAGTGSCDD